MQILDHGYVKLITKWGSEEDIIRSARMSTNKGFQGWEKDLKLLTYLYTHKHMTPFEMAGIIIEVKAPIFVFREWHRHRTQSINEMSARYIPLPDENYVPTLERIMEGAKDTKNKQAQGTGDKLNEAQVNQWLLDLHDSYEYSQTIYERGLNMGVPKEIARAVIPVARYSKMRASANLRNWLGFVLLRQASNAQWEIRQYANAVGDLIAEEFPLTWELFQNENPKP